MPARFMGRKDGRGTKAVRVAQVIESVTLFSCCRADWEAFSCFELER